MSKVTIVSALFDIERIDGRPWEEYLKWFDEFLKLKTPMVLFVSEDLKEFIEERRKDIPTEIIVRTNEDIPYYHLQDKIQSILDDEDYKTSIEDPARIECKQAMYSVIQYSKFPWLKEAVQKNPHGSDYFFWLDAGGSRFFGLYDLEKEYPDIEENIGSWRVENGYCFQKYETESDGYKSWHCESSNLNTASRLLVWSFYLNNAKSGTQFRHFRTTRAKMGRGVIFPAAWTHFHKSEPNKGLKYLVTGWVRYE